MNELTFDLTQTTEDRETAVSQQPVEQDQLAMLFNSGWGYLVNRQWQRAEETFAHIEAFNSHYEQDGLRASYLREKAQYEREAEAALRAGDLETALEAFKKADDFEQAKEVFELLTIQELETKAEKAASITNYQEAAWVYDHLLNTFPEHEREPFWQIKKEGCWEAELLPYFQIGTQALEESKWRTAYHAFAQVLITDPYFRVNGHSAGALAEIARKEVVLWADQQLRQGAVQQALAAYREVGHLARIENIDEFLRLRLREEESARQLETERKWQEAATKYNYLGTLYYDENGRNQWETAAARCLEESRLILLYERAMTAYNKERWREAEKLFGEIVAIRPDYQPDDTSARNLHRSARWRNFLSYFSPNSDSATPKIQTGSLS